MKLLHSRALLSASRATRQCREARYTPPRPIYLSTYNPRLQYSLHRSLTTTTTKTNPNPNPRKDSDPQNDPSISLPDEVRLLMRRVPYPVAIITSTTPPSTTESNPDPPSNFRGMTVSSFNTVTLTPKPIISFNVRRPSETLHALLSSGRFLVHLLAPNQDTVALARDFARGNQGLARSVGGEEGKFEFVGYAPLSLSRSGSGSTSGVVGGREGREGRIHPLPMLRGRNNENKDTTDSTSRPGSACESECFPFIFECRLLPEGVVEVYDHTIVVGTIVRAISSPDPASAIDAIDAPQDLCLTYANTRFWEMGREI
ncbi:flavin reductase like domain-containing protein [Aspergillus cavernicola]|uniref:Flavin reductase like domain-containing protein n=1 Tax=Aspergillus cavernicola TaxID=176166 RepID=A0ABR4HXK2_9EURO